MRGLEERDLSFILKRTSLKTNKVCIMSLVLTRIPCRDMTDGDQMILENFHFLSSHKTLLKEGGDNLLLKRFVKLWQFKFKSNLYHNENDHFSKLEK